MGRYSAKVSAAMKEPPEMLDAETHKWWMNVIMEDDVENVEDIIQIVDDVEKNRLLNGTFYFHKKLPKQFSHSSYLKFSLTRPWCIAGVSHAHAVMGLMLANNVDVTQKDCEGNNIMHALILTAYLEPSLEEEMNATCTFLKEALTLDQLRSILDETNDDGFKPLEYAAHLSVFVIMQNIFQTKGIYLIEEEINSVYTMEWYVVDDYEKKDKTSRHWFSPLYLLMLIDDSKVTDFNANQAFASPLVQNWVNMKMKKNMPFIIMWFLIRALFFVAFVLSDIPPSEVLKRLNRSDIMSVHESNTSSNNSFETNSTDCNVSFVSDIDDTTSIVFLMYMLLHSGFVILFDILEYIMLIPKTKFVKMPKGWKQPCLTYGFYRQIQFFQAVFIVTRQVCRLLAVLHITSFPVLVDNVLYIFITMSQVWSFLFFAQLLPWIGHFVIAVVSMVIKLMKFLIIYCAFSFPFVGSFQRLLNSGKTQGDCPEEFSSFGYSFYTVFTVMLNMVDFRKFSPADETSVFLLHTAYVFMTAILLVNFLIALFSTSFMRVDDHKQVMQTVQRLSVCWLVESRMNRWLFSGVNRWLTQRAIPTTSDGRYAVPSLVVCKSQQTRLESTVSVRREKSKQKRPIVSVMMR